jgi:hypothetical protein
MLVHVPCESLELITSHLRIFLDQDAFSLKERLPELIRFLPPEARKQLCRSSDDVSAKGERALIKLRLLTVTLWLTFGRV